MAAYGGGHVNIIVKLYRELVSRGHSPVVFGLTMAVEKLEKEEVPYISYVDFLDNEKEEVFKVGEDLCREMSLNNAISLEETVSYMGINYLELISSHGKKKAEEIYSKEGRQSFLPLQFASKVLDKISPDIVIATNSPRTEEALIRVAMKKGVATYVVNDFYDEEEMQKRTGEVDYCTKMFVALDGTRKKLLDYGWDPDNILLSGNPVFDSIHEPILPEVRKCFLKEFNPGSKKIILWVKSIFHVFEQAERETETRLIDLVSNDDSYVLLIKPHPNDPRVYQDCLNCRYLLNDSILVHDLLKLIDVVVTVNSTVGLEANILGKPVVQIATFDYAQKIPFEKLGIGKEVTDFSQLVDLLKEEVENGGTVERTTYPKNATKFIVDEILK